METAQTPPQKAYALGLQYDVWIEQADKMANDPLTDPAVKEGIKVANRLATPLIKELRTASDSYVILKAQFEAAEASGLGDLELARAKTNFALEQLNTLLPLATAAAFDLAIAIGENF